MHTLVTYLRVEFLWGINVGVTGVQVEVAVEVRSVDHEPVRLVNHTH